MFLIDIAEHLGADDKNVYHWNCPLCIFTTWAKLDLAECETLATKHAVEYHRIDPQCASLRLIRGGSYTLRAKESLIPNGS